jgi:hypothetical protein
VKRRALLFLLLIVPLYAQESQLGAEFRREAEHLKSGCSSFSFGTLASCGQILFTGQPLHIAVGSIAPGNGVAGGLALVSHWTPNESWRMSWDADAVASSNGSWRAGAYLTAIFTKRRGITVSTGGSAAPRSTLAITERPVFHAYAQGTSLNKIGYFGLGPDTRDFNRSFFGMRETIVGANAVWPLINQINLAVFGEANGRFVDIRGAHGYSSPSIEQIYSEATAPGLIRQPAFAQFGEGVRVRPNLAAGYVRLNYSFAFQQYVAPSSSFSFRRITTDLGHQFPLYRKTRTYLPRDFNGPNDCSADVTVHQCPAITRNLEGSFGFRFLLTESFVPTGNVVPFYFDPTIGGSDINGVPWLPSYQDYRFRGPNLMVLRATFEHSIYGPLGVTFMRDDGKVTLRREDIDFSHLAHSYAAGLTLRAGGLPLVYLLFAWGGHEGHHTTASISNSLLGASPRPSLY